MQTRFRLALLALFLAFSNAAWAGERGYFGFGLSIDGEGVFWNPTLRAVKIDKVFPQSPAALAGIVPGDEVVEVAGHVVAGAKGKDIQVHIEKDIGQSVQVKVRHANGDMLVATLVATAKTWK